MFRRLSVLFLWMITIVSPLFAQSLEEPSSNSESAAIMKLIINRNPGVSPENAELIADSLVESGEQHDVDPKLVAAIMSVESRFNHRASNRGALGLGQLMRGTARHLGVSDPFSITQNVSGTTKYMKAMMDLWTGHPEQTAMALASYLKGPGAVKRSKKPLSGRAKNYVESVMFHYNRMVDYGGNGDSGPVTRY